MTDQDDISDPHYKNDLESVRIVSLTELKSMKSSKTYDSNMSNVSNKSQKKQKRRKSNKELRKIRDKPSRMCRKASTAPDQAFIVEEALLEDLCAIAGEEAHDGGNIILSREKEELIRRLSMNQATSDVFKNTTSIRKFSTNSLRSAPSTLSQTLDEDCRRSTLTPRDSASQYFGRISQNSSVTNRGSLLKQTVSNRSNRSSLSNVGVEEIEDTVRLRRQSIKQVQTTSPKGAHELMTQANYRTEIQALKMAQKRESCTCARNCFALCNIYI